MTEKPAAEEYVYHIGKIRFIVTPVYKETGELMRDILLKLMHVPFCHFFDGFRTSHEIQKIEVIDYEDIQIGRAHV